ncbi:MAG: methyltransferase domain-containing protein [bacterium]|nr:MAG: methyltransferase domain-containing protein [bacterium]
MASKRTSTARQTAEIITTYSWAYRYSIVILTANRLRIFDALAAKPVTARSLAHRSGLDVRALTILLDALTAMGLVVKEKQRYRCPRDVSRYLAKDSPDYQGNILDHRFNLLQHWVHLPEVVTGGGPAPSRRRRRGRRQHRDFILAMANIARTAARALAEAIDIDRYNRLLDLGGGPGTYTIALCSANTHLTATLYDLPETEGIAREEIRRAGLGERITFTGGDYLHDPLGNGYDLVLASNIIHSLSLAQTESLMRNARRAMIPGGTIIIKEFYLDESRTGPLDSALFAVNMLVGTAGGNAYTPSEIKRALKKAGFSAIRMRRLDDRSALYTARNPK